MRGVMPELEDQVADIGAHMKGGRLADLQPGEFGIVLGADLARALRVQLGERVTLIAPQGQVTPAGLVPRLKQFRVVGIFSVGHYEYDSGLALVRMEDAQVLYRMGDAASGVRLKLRDLDEAPRVSRELAKTVTGDAYLTDWTQQNANYFRAIQIEKRMMFIILTLIIAVAAFNLVSTLVMVVTDKHPDIAILRTLGASPAAIMKIFMVQGTLHRRHRHGARRAARGAPVAQHRRRRARGRARVRLPDPVARGLLHQRAALAARLAGRVDGGGRGAGARLPGDALPELARGARQSGGGAAL